jgi:hypothetical protein
MANLAKKAQDRAASEYDWDKISKETALTYQELAGQFVTELAK